MATALAALLFTVGCSTPDAGDATATETTKAEIAWFEGSVEEAFAYAKDNSKPVFLYWGAVWCPPCHYLTDKIFVKPEFVAKSRLFVPVYLDGDTDRAQIWGEKLDINGYPTVLILDPDGTEVLRMSADVPIEEYTHVLDLALEATRPIGEVLASVLEQGPAKAARNDLGQLAYHSWGQDRDFDFSSADMLNGARRLWFETPSEFGAERARFLSLYTEVLGYQEEVNLNDEERAAMLDEIQSIIAAPELRESNWFLFAYGLEDVAKLLTDEGPDREVLVERWLRAAHESEQDESKTTAERLEAIRPRLAAAALQMGDDGDLPADVVDYVRERVAWATEKTTNAGELQSVMNASAHLLRDSGQKAEAIALLKNRIDDAEAPYYYMSWIGWLENDAGNTDVALEWYRKGWDTATGPATRLERGARFIRTVMDIAPDKVDIIRQDALALADEHLSDESAFSGRNRRTWTRLAGAMLDWAEGDDQRQGVIAAVRAAVTDRCGEATPEADDQALEACAGFLAPVQAM